VDTTGFSVEQRLQLVNGYYAALDRYYGICEVAAGAVSSVATSVSSEVSGVMKRKRPGKNRRRSRPGSSLGSEVSQRACSPGNRPVADEVVKNQVDQSGFCYLGMVLTGHRAEAVRALGRMPTVLSVLDSPSCWFDFSKFDDLVLVLSGLSCHLESGDGLPLRGVLSSLARGCHPVSGTLAAVAVSWKESSAVGFTYDTTIGGIQEDVEVVVMRDGSTLRGLPASVTWRNPGDVAKWRGVYTYSTVGRSVSVVDRSECLDESAVVVCVGLQRDRVSLDFPGRQVVTLGELQGRTYDRLVFVVHPGEFGQPCELSFSALEVLFSHHLCAMQILRTQGLSESLLRAVELMNDARDVRSYMISS
jgi:hypothetical protein